MKTSTATVRISLPRLHPEQARIKQALRRFSVLNLGRRTGKTVFGINIGTTAALKGDAVGWFAPHYKYLTEVMESMRYTLTDVIRRFSFTEKRLELITGGYVEFWSLDNPDAGRSRGYDLAIVDEAAMAANLKTAWNASIRPTLSDRKGRGLFLSTPKGSNFFRELHERGMSDDFPDWMAWTAPTATNPHIPPEEIEAASHDLPERIFRQEYLAEFITDSGTVFRNISACINPDIQPGRKPGHIYTIGVDWGKLHDYSVFTVLDATALQVVEIVRLNRIDYRLQRAELAALSEKYRPAAILCEINSMGEPNFEELDAMGLPVLPFTTTNRSKNEIIDSLTIAIERQSIALPSHDQLIRELRLYEAERLPSGLFRYSAPSGEHDDCVMSLAFACRAVASLVTTQQSGIYSGGQRVKISSY